MKTVKIISRSGIALLTLTGLVLAYIYGASSYVFHKKYDIPLIEMEVPADSAAIAEGYRQVQLLNCTGCHGEDLKGKVMHEDDEFGRLVSANVTTIIQDYSDAELYRVIRHGIKKDGTIAFVMPAKSQYHLKDESVAQIIAYLRTLEANENDPPLPEMELRLKPRKAIAFKKRTPEPADMDHRALRVSSNFANNPLAHGEYLAKTVCSHCHGDDLEGSAWRKAPGLSIVFLYSQEQFRHLLRTGEGATRKEVGKMSRIAQMRLKHLRDDEIEALYVYLKSRLETEEELATENLND